MARARNIRDSTSQCHANPCGRFAPPVPLPCRAEKFSFLARAVVAGVRQAWHVEFDRVAAFVATGGKETTNDETGQGKNNTAHYLPPDSRARKTVPCPRWPRRSSEPKLQYRRSQA